MWKQHWSALTFEISGAAIVEQVLPTSDRPVRQEREQRGSVQNGRENSLRLFIVVIRSDAKQWFAMTAGETGHCSYPAVEGASVSCASLIWVNMLSSS